MEYCIRLASLVAFAIPAVMAGSWFVSEVAADPAQHRADYESGQNAHERLRRSKEEGRRLERLRETTFQALDRKEEILVQLVAGRISLAQAAAGFRDAEQHYSPDLMRFVLDMYHGASDEERALRRLMDIAAHSLQDQPGRRAEVARRLEVEMRTHISHPNPENR